MTRKNGGIRLLNVQLVHFYFKLLMQLGHSGREIVHVSCTECKSRSQATSLFSQAGSMLAYRWSWVFHWGRLRSYNPMDLGYKVTL